MEKKYCNALVLVVFVALFAIGCSDQFEEIENEIEMSVDKNEFLQLKSLPQLKEQKDYFLPNRQEDEILSEVLFRILKNVKVDENEKVILNSVNADELNVEPTLFNFVFGLLKPYLTGDRIIGEKATELNMPRMKSSSVESGIGGGIIGGNEGSDGDGGYGGGGSHFGSGTGVGGGGGTVHWTYEQIRNYLMDNYTKDSMFLFICLAGSLSSFETKCFKQYWYAMGNLLLSDDEWNGIKEVTNRSEYQKGKKVIDITTITKDGKVLQDTVIYYVKSISFYDCSEYNYALGTSTITFTEQGEPIGLYDVYDFNNMENRGIRINKITVTIGELGKMFEAEAYELYTKFYRL